MNMSAFEAIVFLVGLYASQAAVCPEDWRQFGEICYFPITTSMSWEDANQACVAKEAQLALPRSQAEQDAIWGMFQEMFPGRVPKHVSIACSDIEEEGNWRPCPLRGEDSDAYENWRIGQPDDDVNYGADCAAMIRFDGGRWGDRPCREPNFAVCERPVETTSFCLPTATFYRPPLPCLLGHVLKEIPVTGVEACGRACLSEPQCLSFNLLRQGPSNMLCQLNTATRDAVVGFGESQQNCIICELWIKQPDQTANLMLILGGGKNPQEKGVPP